MRRGEFNSAIKTICDAPTQIVGVHYIKLLGLSAYYLLSMPKILFILGIAYISSQHISNLAVLKLISCDFWAYWLLYVTIYPNAGRTTDNINYL